MTEYTEAQVQRNRADWLAYLREPGRKKAISRLVSPNDLEERCCLGHYCAMQGLTPEPWPYSDARAYQGETIRLPVGMAKSLNITPTGLLREPLNLGVSHLNSAAEINDYSYRTLAQIADILEQQFESDNLMPYGE